MALVQRGSLCHGPWKGKTHHFSPLHTSTDCRRRSKSVREGRREEWVTKQPALTLMEWKHKPGVWQKHPGLIKKKKNKSKDKHSDCSQILTNTEQHTNQPYSKTNTYAIICYGSCFNPAGSHQWWQALVYTALTGFSPLLLKNLLCQHNWAVLYAWHWWHQDGLLQEPNEWGAHAPERFGGRGSSCRIDLCQPQNKHGHIQHLWQHNTRGTIINERTRRKPRQDRRNPPGFCGHLVNV